MAASDNSICCDLVGLLKSIVPWRSNRANVSRDFWIPDESCRVCYECDSQFTLFNRRHHCRHCGRVFCGKCTLNWVPAPSSEPELVHEEWEKIRVCNFCFKQWELGLAGTVDDGNGAHVANLDLSSSPSNTSFITTKSNITANSSSITLASVSHSVGSDQQKLYSSGPSPRNADVVIETNVEREGVVASRRGNEHVADLGDQSPSQFEFCMNRIGDDDDEFGVYQLDSNPVNFPQVNGYYGQFQFGEVDNGYGSHKVHPDEEAIDVKCMSSTPLHNSFDTQKHDIGDECEAPSTLYASEDVGAEPVDFENNGVLWLPPEPEDGEDERESLLFDDEDDGDGNDIGEWGRLRNSSSFGSGEFRSRDRSNDEHKKAMKSVVDGHFRALVSQLLQVENLLTGEEDESENWLEIISYLSWEAASLLKPDTSKGGGMDPGGYVKIKCIASGRRCESMVVKGVVCKKNVAHRRMTSRKEKPRFLILGGALEYQRVSNHLSSFDTLLQQEMDHLKMAVAKINSHNPDILLVEKAVSRYAQEYLLAKDISLVLNIKRPLLERIARCTGGQIIPSIDHLSSQRLGYCDMFHVERFLEEHGTAGQGGKKLVKTLMYFEGCPKPLGCTILLRGANGDELKKVKHVVQYGVFAAYHLALETSFLADEGASLPELPLNAPITVALPDKPLTIDRSISTISGFSLPMPKFFGEPQRSYSVPIPELVSTISNVPSFQNSKPSLNFTNSADSLSSIVASGNGVLESPRDPPSVYSSTYKNVVGLTDNGLDITGNCLGANGFGPQNDCGAMIENQSSLDPSSVQVPSKEEFPPSPSDHQSILVSLSSRCVWKGTVCERSHLFRIKYYGNFDKPLGRFLRDHLFDQGYRCRSCEMPSEAHVHCYTHRQGTLTISVKKLPEFLLPGEREGKIWMWHRCLRCPRTNGFPPATRRIVMSDAAWGLSFGKFLELSFSNHAAASRVASCGHSLHRDCLRFYGFGNMVACFRYASIDVHSVYLPPHKLDFNYENQEWIRRELHEVIGREELLFSEVHNALCSLNISMKLPESRRQIVDLEEMLQNEKIEFEESLQKIVNKEVKKGQPHIDILEINWLRRQLLFQSYMWDHRLIYVASSDSNSIQGEHMEKPLSTNEKLIDINIPVHRGKGSNNFDSLLADTKLDEHQNPGGDYGVETGLDLNPNKEDQAKFCVGTNSCDGFHHSELNAIVHRTLSDGQFPIGPTDSLTTMLGLEDREEDQSGPKVSCLPPVHLVLSDGQFPLIESLSDTLDAAWTGENNPGNAYSVAADSSTTASVAETFDLEDRGEDPCGPKVPVLSSKGSDNMEDSMGWLGIPFINFYRSLNKNFLGSSHKLDSFSEYNPIYISSFREAELKGGARLLLPVGVNDTVVPIYDDEPTSIISYTLLSPDYLAQVSDELDRRKDSGEFTFPLMSFDSGNF